MAKRKNKSNKIRTEFKKNYDSRRRKNDLTRDFDSEKSSMDDVQTSERVSGKGRWTRKRTVVGDVSDDEKSGFQVAPDVNKGQSLTGRVLRVHGLNCIVEVGNEVFDCAVRGLLKSMATDLQNVVVAGDWVQVDKAADGQGVVARVEERHNFINRTSRGRQQIIASNIDQALIVASLDEPTLKPNLIDRLLIAIEKAGIQPIIVLNKIDLVDLGTFQPMIGVWSQLGYTLVMVSAAKGFGVQSLREITAGKDSVVTGQSGVGKSSILNAIEPGLARRIGGISSDNNKGTHTTTTAELVPLAVGGHVIDTPGIRQFQLWDVIPEEVEGYFRDIRPFVHQCRFPNCSHTHEDDCAVKNAVADGWIDVRRYDSFCQIRSGE